MGTYINGLWYADDQIELGRDGALRPKTGFVHSALAGMPDVAAADDVAVEVGDVVLPVADASAETPVPVEVDDVVVPVVDGGVDTEPVDGAKQAEPATRDKERHPVTRDKGAFSGR